MRATDVAYAAGIIDGEGHVRLKRYVRPTANGTPYISWAPEISVANTDFALLDWLHKSFGGSICPQKIRNGVKPVRRWSVANRRAVECAAQVLPYARIKRKRLALLVQFDSLRFPAGRARQQGVPKTIAEKRETLYQELRYAT